MGYSRGVGWAYEGHSRGALVRPHVAPQELRSKAEANLKKRRADLDAARAENAAALGSVKVLPAASVRPGRRR